MTLHFRKYDSEDDYWRMRTFLREVYLLNDRRDRSWDVVRFDYWRYHVMANCHELPYQDYLLFWEDDQGQIAAALVADDPGVVFLQVHPALRSQALEEEMIAAAEEYLSVERPDGGRALTLWADAQDTLRQGLLERRGYTRGDHPEYQRRRALRLPIPGCPPVPGYTVRALGDIDEHPARSWASWKGFHPDEPDERYQGYDWYINVQRCPLYRRDLDLVAVAPNGAIASFCTVWFDDLTRTGVFEPVATHPDHLRRGLASAVMSEGLRRLQWYGADLATVSSYSDAAGKTYASLGFTEFDLSYPWRKG